LASAALIAMLAVGEGASQQALESIKRLGSENFMVMSVKRPMRRARTPVRSAAGWGLWLAV
jgi:putative ABC transport system permease protein